MRLENVGQPPSVASHPLPDREQLPWKASRGLLWSEAHWTPLPVSSPAVPTGHTQLPAVHQPTLLPVQPLRMFASSLLCWEYLPSLHSSAGTLPPPSRGLFPPRPEEGSSCMFSLHLSFSQLALSLCCDCMSTSGP